MTKYNSCGDGCNNDVANHVERVTEHWAQRVSRKTGLSYPHALALVRANVAIKEARNG